MKKISRIILLSGIAFGCSNNSSKPNLDCDEPMDINAIYTKFKTEGQPFAEIDFEKNLDPKWIKSDFQILRLILEEANPNTYRYAEKSKMDSIFQRVTCQLNDSISYRDFTKYIAKVFNTMACGHSGWTHSKEFRAFRNQKMKFFPLEILSVNDQYFVVKNNSTDTSIVEGMEILSINGSKPVSLNKTLRKYMYRDGESIPKAETEISKYFTNAYSNFIDNPEIFSLEMSDYDGNVIEVQIQALDRSKIDSISLARYGNQKGMGKPLLFEIDSASSTARYTIKWFNKEYIHKQGQEFYSFTDSVFQELETNEVENLIIDLRGNVGGWTANGKKLFSFFIEDTIPYIRKVEFARVDSFSFEPLILSDQGISDTMKFEQNERGLYEWINYPNIMVIPSPNNRFNGNVYIITNEESRSCSSVFSSLMMSHTNSTFIGQDCGAAQCGSGGMVISAMLPYTGITIFTSTAKYSSNVSEPNYIGGVEVDYPVKSTIQDYLNNYDRQLEFTYDLIKKTNHNKTYKQ